MSEVYAEQNAGDEATGARGQTDYVNVTAATPLAKAARFVRVTPPASSSYIVSTPLLSECKGAHIAFVCVSTAGGEVQIKSRGDGVGEAGTAADLVGDNLSAVGDYVLLYNTGLKWIVVKEVTT